MFNRCITVLCSFLIVILLITIISHTCTEGFRTNANKIILSERIVRKGKPVYSNFKNMGLDGVEYYDAKQLWNNKKYDITNLKNIL